MSGSELLSMTGLTLQVALIATTLSLPFALAIAHALARHEFTGKPLLQALLALPMVLPPVAIGIGLLLALGRRGPLGPLWETLGVDLVFSWWAAAIAAAVVGFPLLVRACEQAFGDVDPRLERVSRSLGLGPWQTFWRVTLPLARRGVLYGVVLAFSRALGEFGATAIVAGILPGRTETLALGIYSRVQLGDDAGALALCAASFVLALSAMLVAETWLRRPSRRFGPPRP
jgi:molybdate transport system permease protein